MFSISRTALILAALTFASMPAFAQGVDIAGDWAARGHEDQPHRAPGAELGDYTGLPINAAARQKASHWDASILSLPYALLSDSVPAAKMGVFMGIFNFFIVIPQLVAASLLGFLLRHFFGGQPIQALTIGGISLIVAGLCVLRVQEPRSATVAATGH